MARMTNLFPTRNPGLNIHRQTSHGAEPALP
jgi:hypothetical protein